MRPRMILPLMITFIFGSFTRAEAGGLYLYELGTEDVGLANAGNAARADDASVIAGNPAGMTRLEGQQLTLGVQMLYGDVDYTMENPNQRGPGNVVGWLPGASTFYSHSLNDDLKLGVALYGNFGLSLDYGKDWAGNNLVRKATLMGLTLQPSLAYRLTEQWSVGAGVGINYGIFSLERDRLNGDSHTLDDTDVAPNVKLGILYELSSATRFGLTYTSKVDYDFDVDADGYLPITNTPWSLPIAAAVSAPQQIMLSAVQDLNSQWSLLANIGWQDWSSFSEAEVTAGGITRSSSLQLQDTWHGAIGCQYKATTDTHVNFGIAYDSSMYDDQDNTSLFLPTGAVWRFGTGVMHQLNDRSSIGTAIEYLNVEDARVVSPAVLAGTYDDPQMYFMAIHYNYRF